MTSTDIKKIGKRIWIWIVILTTIVWLYPVEYRVTRIAELVGPMMVWVGAFFLWPKQRILRWALITLAAIPVLLLSLPGREPEPAQLVADYTRALRCFRGVRYVWGGEGVLGVDCSGLVRKGLIWGQIHNGLRTVNGKPIRDAVSLWWHDGTARDMEEGYDGRTTKLFEQASIGSADYSRLQPGDLATVSEGVHVMAYLGNRTWIEADPEMHKVIVVTLPTDNPWFTAPVVFVRWKCLMDGPTTTL